MSSNQEIPSASRIAARDRESSIGYFGWRVVAGAVVGLLLSPGPMILLLVGTLAPYFGDAYGWPLPRVMFGLTLFGFASILAAPTVGYLADRLGIRRILLFSILAMAGSLFLFGYAVQTLWQFYLVCFLYGFFGYGAQSLTYNKLLTEWFDARRGLAIGFASAGLGLGYVILPSVISFLFQNYGPRSTFFAAAGIVLVVSFGTNFFSAVSPAARPARVAASAPADGMTVSAAIRTPAFWLLASAILLISTVVTGVVPQIAKLCRDLGYSKENVTLIATSFGVVTLAMRLLVGGLLDRVFAPRVGTFAFILTALGCGLVALRAYVDLPIGLLMLGVSLIGVGYGTESDIVSFLTGRYFGKKHFGAIYGWQMTVFLVGVSIGPFVYGFVRATTGSYGPAFLLAAGLALVSGLIMRGLPAYDAPRTA